MEGKNMKVHLSICSLAFASLITACSDGAPVGCAGSGSSTSSSCRRSAVVPQSTNQTSTGLQDADARAAAQRKAEEERLKAQQAALEKSKQDLERQLAASQAALNNAQNSKNNNGNSNGSPNPLANIGTSILGTIGGAVANGIAGKITGAFNPGTSTPTNGTKTGTSGSPNTFQFNPNQNLGFDPTDAFNGNIDVSGTLRK